MSDSDQSKVRRIFPDMAVYKSARRSKQFAALSLPSYLRDWIVMRFADASGQVDMDEVHGYVRQTIPRREDWEALKSRMVNLGEAVRFLAKVQAEIDIKSGEGLFSLPDFGFPRRRYEAIIASSLVREKREDLLRSAGESWGSVELEWRVERLGSGSEEGHIIMTDFRPFRPYRVETDFFQQARIEFSLEEVKLLNRALDHVEIKVDMANPEEALLQRFLTKELYPLTAKLIGDLEGGHGSKG